MLYVHETADPAKALAVAEASLDRLGVCNRLNLCLVDREARAVLPALISLFRRLELEMRGTPRALEMLDNGLLPLDTPIGYEWASDESRVATVSVDVVDSLDDAVAVANEHTSGLAAAIIAEDGATAEQFLDELSRHRGVLEREHQVHRRVRAHGRTGDRDQRRPDARAPRARHVSRPLAAAVPGHRRREPAPMTRSVIGACRGRTCPAHRLPAPATGVGCR